MKSIIDDLIQHLPEKDSKLWRAINLIAQAVNKAITDFTNYLSLPLNYPISFNVVGIPAQDETTCLLVIPKGVTLTFLADFLNSWAIIGINPTAQVVYKIRRQRPNVLLEEMGTLTIETDGSFRFENLSHRLTTWNYKYQLLITTPNPQDATLSDVYITLAGRVNRV